MLADETAQVGEVVGEWDRQVVEYEYGLQGLLGGLLCVHACCGEERRIVGVQRGDDTRSRRANSSQPRASAERSEPLMKHDAFP